MMLKDHARNAAHRRRARRATERHALTLQRVCAGACMDCGAYCNADRDSGGYCRTCLRRRLRAGTLIEGVVHIPPSPPGTTPASPPR